MNITYRNDHIGSYKGQQDYQLFAIHDGHYAGVIEYSTFDNEVYINYMMVTPHMRRKGIATGLWNELKSLWDGWDIDTGDIASGDGIKFFRSLGAVRKNPGYADERAIKDSMLTVLSYGAGQDSTALLLMYIHDIDNFRDRFAPDDFIVVMSDTGKEFPETDEYREYIEDLCDDNDIEYYFLECGGKYHSPSYPSLAEFYNRTKT